MTKLILILFLGIFSISSSAQSETDEVLETKATITHMDFRITGKRSVSEATVAYTTQDGVKLESKVKLAHVPFITSIYSVGDKITVRYRKENPGILTTPFLDFIHTYGLYFLIGIGIIISVFRLYKVRSAQYI